MNVRCVAREELERLAYIVGNGSAAADALRAADEYAGDVRFYIVQDRRGMQVILERVAQTTGDVPK